MSLRVKIDNVGFDKVSAINVNRSVLTSLDSLLLVPSMSESMVVYQIASGESFILGKHSELNQREYLGGYTYPLKSTKGILNRESIHGISLQILSSKCPLARVLVYQRLVK